MASSSEDPPSAIVGINIPEWVCAVIDHVARYNGLRYEQACKLLILQGARVYRERIEKHAAGD